MLRRRPFPYLPQAGEELPGHPAEDATNTEREAYARFVMANFVSDRWVQPQQHVSVPTAPMHEYR